MYPYEYMGSFKKISEDKLPDRCKDKLPFSYLKDECISEKKIFYILLVFGICLKWIQRVIIMIFI